MHTKNQLQHSYPGSRKIYISGAIHSHLKVPMREILLSDSSTFCLYDTSGPYTDPKYSGTITKGLPDIRSQWINARRDTAHYSAIR